MQRLAVGPDLHIFLRRRPTKLFIDFFQEKTINTFKYVKSNCIEMFSCGVHDDPKPSQKHGINDVFQYLIRCICWKLLFWDDMMTSFVTEEIKHWQARIRYMGWNIGNLFSHTHVFFLSLIGKIFPCFWCVLIYFPRINSYWLLYSLSIEVYESWLNY